jgi:oxaloacetate decarboxylase gamma subunit
MNDLFSQAIDLLILGMGFVFIFLTLLVFVTRGMSKIAMRLEPAVPVVSSTSESNIKTTPANNLNDPQLIAVITAAVNQFRTRHKK